MRDVWAKPQSAPPMMFSGPRILAKRSRRWATSLGCSTVVMWWLMTPGMRILPSGSFACSHTSHSHSCLGLAASMEYAPAFTCRMRSMIASSGASATCGTCHLPQRLGGGVDVLFLGLVVLVHPVVCHAGRRDAREEDLTVRLGRLHGGKVAGDEVVAGVADGPAPPLRGGAGQRGRHLRVVGEELPEPLPVPAEPVQRLELVFADLEAGDPGQRGRRPARPAGPALGPHG